MSNFKAAFEKGIQHAEEAEINENEINQVLDEFAGSISEFTDQKLQVRVEKRFDPQNNSPFGLAATAALLSNTGRHYEALVVSNCMVDKSPEYELCEWKLSEKGYPVRLQFDGISPSCGDKESLIKSLSDLISKPRTGKIFNRLLNLSDSNGDSDD